MRQKLLLTCLLASFSFLFFQCQKEISTDILPHTRGNAPVTATLQGTITDENGLPATGVIVKVGTRSAFTDAKGYFRITRAALDKENAVVTAEKAGYFKAYRSFAATTGANHVSIKLIRKQLAGTIPATGGEVSLTNGAKVALPANGVVLANGTTYNGTVNVYAAFIDPTANDIGLTIPGSLMADDINGRRTVLTSYGMMAVELESSTGQKLQVAPAATATLTMPIPGSIQSSAPASISLWYIDEQTGIWQEEGTATKNGNVYVGQVKHFSFWNCDVSSQAIRLSMTLQTNHGAPLVHVPVKLTRPNGSYSWGYTDSIGEVSGYVPSNESLLLEVLDPCGNAVYSQQVGPFAQNTNLGVIVVSSSGSSLITITGRLTNCSGAPVTNGSAIISYNNSASYVSVNSNGEFTLSVTYCGGNPTTCAITGVDNSNQQQATLLNVMLVSPITNAGTISACGTSAAQFINYTVNSTTYSLTSTNTQADSLFGWTNTQNATPFRTSLVGSNQTLNNAFISINFNSPQAAGTYPVTALSVNNVMNAVVVAPFNVSVTNFPAISGGFYEGSFSGQFRDSLPTAPLQTISGTFKLRRL